MADEKVSKTGIWFDTESREVVDGEQPENAIQLVAPGHPVTANAQIVIDNWRDVDQLHEQATDNSVVETAAQKPPVTTQTVTPKKS